MKLLILNISFFLISSESFGQSIREMELQYEIVHKITVGYKKGVTTVMFPSAIKGIYGANIVADSKHASYGAFLLSFQPGNYYFSLRALKEKARGSLNIVYNRKIYVFALSVSDIEYDGSITLAATSRSYGGSSKGGRTTPSLLVSLLDRAKAYPLFKKHHPESVGPEKLDYYRPNPAISMEYSEFDIEINEVFRFKHHDTLIFSVYLVNKTDRVLVYDPRLFSVRTGNHVLYPTLSDASGSIPPKTKTPAYFAVCGNGTGGRNNLSAKNDWSAYLTIERFVDEWKDKREFIDKILNQNKEILNNNKINDRFSTGSFYSIGSADGKSRRAENSVEVKKD
jgi:hypothetical protein